MAEVSVSVIGKDMLSASFGAMRTTVSGLSSEILALGNRAVSPVTIALGNLLSDVVKNGVNALNNLKGTIESFNFIKLNMEMEMTRSSFTTLLKSGDEANKMLETLRQYANFTPFEFSQLTAATKKMLAFGFSAKEITTDFMGIGTGLLDVVGNASSALGAGQEGIDRITRALGQMRGLARVSAEDMNQLIDVGVQGYQILAEQLGMTVKEVRDAMKAGQLDAETGIKALLQGMMQQYGGGMASFSQTAEGMSSTLNDYLKDIQRTFGEIAYKEYRLLLGEINRLVSSPAFVKFAQMLGVQFGGAVKKLNEQVLFPAIQRMTTFVNKLGETDEAMQTFFNGIMAKIYPLAALFRELGNAFKTVIEISAQFVRALIATSDAQQAIEWLGRQVAKATEMLFDFASGTRVSGQAMTAFAEQVVAALKPGAVAIVRFTPVLKELIAILMAIGKEMFQLNATQSILRTIIDTYVNLASTFDSLVPRLRAFREAIPDMTQNVIAALGPARNVLSGFIDVLMSAGKFIGVFVMEILGLRQTQSALSSIPDRLNAFADALRGLAARIDTMTARLPAFFDYLENLPTLIRTTIASLFPLSTIIDQVKNYLKELVQEAVQFVVKFTIIGRVLNTVNEVFKRVAASLAPFVGFLVDMVNALLQALGISTKARSFFDALAAGVAAVLAAIARALPSYNQMLTVFTAIVNIVKAGFPVVIAIIQEIIAVIVSLAQQITSQLPSIQSIVMGVIDILKTLANTIIGVLPDIAAIVTQVIDAIKGVLNAIAPFAPQLTNLLNQIISVISRVIDTLIPLAGPVMAVISDVISAIERLVNGIMSQAGPIGEAINSIIGAVSRIFNEFMNLLPSVGSVLSGIIPIFNTLVSALIELVQIGLRLGSELGPSLNSLGNTFQGFVNFVLELIRVIVDNLAPIINGISSTMGPVMESLGSFGRSILNVMDALLKVTLEIGKFAAPFTAPAMIAAIDWLTRAANALANFLFVVRDAIRTGDMSRLGSMFKTFGDNVATALGGTLQNLLSPENVAYALVTGKANLINFIITTLTEVFIGALGNIEKNLPTWVQNSASYMSRLVPLLLEELRTSWETLSSTLVLSASGILNALDGVWNTIKTVTGTETDTTAGLAGNLPNAVAAMWIENAPAMRAGMEAIMAEVRNGYYNTWEWIRTNIGSREQFIALSSDLGTEYANFSREVANKSNDMLSEFVANIVSFLTGPNIASAMRQVRDDLGFAAEELFFRLGVIMVDLTKTAVKNQVTGLTNTLMTVINDLPQLLAGIFAVFEQIETTINVTVLRSIQGLITGIISALGMTDWVPAIDKFFDDTVQNIEESSRKMMESLNNFSNWWRSLELGTMLRNFTQFTFDFATNVMPQVVAAMARLPELLISLTSSIIKTALTDMITTLQNGITAITDRMNLGSVSQFVRESFQNIRDGIADIGGPMQQQMDFINEYNELLRQIGRENAQLMQQYGFTNASAATAANNTIARTATTIAKASATVNKSDIGEFAQNLNNAQGQMRTALVNIANTLSGEAVSLFTPVGTRIAQGVLDGFLASMPYVESAMRSALDGISGSLSLSGAAAPTSRGVSSISTVNNKNVMLNLTVNQTTPTTLVENIRYAQALATSRIY